MGKLFSIVTLCLLSVTSIASEWVIGLDADMSAVAKEGGIAIQRGAQIAIDEINAQGGLLGKQVRLEVRDHRGNPARGLANIKKFAKDENLLAVLGGVHTPVALHELPAIHEHNVLYLDPWAAGTPIVDNGFDPNFVFRLSVRDQHAGGVLLAEAHRRGIKKVALLLERTGWGRSNENSMNLAAKKLDIEIVSVQWFNWKEKSYQAQFDAIKASNAQGIMLVANAPEGIDIVKHHHNVGLKLPILSHWGISAGEFVSGVGIDVLSTTDLSVLQTFSFEQSKNNPHSERLYKTYEKNYASGLLRSQIPSQVGVAHAYDLVKILAMAVEESNSSDSEVLQKQLENLTTYSGVLKDFKPPFTKKRHDALEESDYIISKFNNSGNLVPIK